MAASVIVRTKNSAATLEAALAGLIAQTHPVQIVVVDSGSSDTTLEIARRYTDTVVEIPADRFSYGRALNTGVTASAGDVILALSSHVVPPRPDWIARCLAHHADPQVVAVCGSAIGAAEEPLVSVVRQDLDLACTHPFWGLTNTAASWRADVVRAYPFDEDLEACEDKEWAVRVLAATGGVVVIDPELVVDSSHRTRQGMRRYLDRVRRERRALLRAGILHRQGARVLLRDWWTSARAPQPGRRGLTSVTRALDALAHALAEWDVARSSDRSRRAQ